MKKVREIKSTIDTTSNTLTINTDGKDEIIIRLSALNQSMIDHAALHGLKQKICDGAALGIGYTLTEKYNAMLEIVERISGDDGSWNKRAEGAGAITGLLFRALVRLYPAKSSEVLRAYHDKLDKVQQAALRKNPKVAAIIEDIKAESVKTAGIDTTGMLDELEGLE